MPPPKIRLPLPKRSTASFGLPVFLFFSTLTSATPVLAEPELRATAHAMRGVTVPRMAPMSASANQSKFSLGSDQSKFNLGTDQSKFNLGTNRSQTSAKSAVGIKVDKENPAIMTIVGGTDADIQKLLAKRYHRVVIPITPYSAPAGPMQQVVNQQQVNGQSIIQQMVAQQTIAAQPQQPQQVPQVQWQKISAVPIETLNRFFNILSPGSKPSAQELSAQAKKLKPFDQATYIRWDPWYKRIQAVANGRWQSYNNQLNTEVTAHVTVYPTDTLAVTGLDVNLWKSAHPWDTQFNDATKQAALETLNSLKGSPILKFPAHTRRTEVSFDLIFVTGGRGGVGVNAPINDVETVYGL